MSDKYLVQLKITAGSGTQAETTSIEVMNSDCAERAAERALAEYRTRQAEKGPTAHPIHAKVYEYAGEFNLKVVDRIEVEDATKADDGR